MAGLKVCRICLRGDGNMYDLSSYPLGTYYEQIIGMNPLCLMQLPTFACAECAQLTKKYYFFREKCLTGQTTFYDILNVSGQISLTDLQQIDRKTLNLTSKLTTHCIKEDSYITHIHKDEEPVQEIKSCVYQVDDLFDIKVKVEEDFMDTGFPSSDSDDEPLSVHKSLTEKKEEKKKGGKKRKRELLNEEEEPLSETELEPSSEKPASPTPARKRGRPRKTPPSSSEQRASPTPARKRGRPRKTPAAPKRPPKRRTKNTGGVAADELNFDEYVDVIKLSMEEQIEEITKRQESSNYLNAPYQCKLCYKGFIETKAWKHHVAKHSPSSGDVECAVCRFRFATRRALQKHAANHEKKYQCKSCSYVSKTTTQAKQHHRWHKGVTYKCQYCDEISTKWTSYLSHVRIKHPSQFICGVCGYSFVSKLGLTMHKTMMHKGTEQSKPPLVGPGSPAPPPAPEPAAGPYCADCDVQFVSDEAWKRHMVTSVRHTQDQDFNNGCRVCGETFANHEELRLHHRREHARKRPKNYGKKPSLTSWPTKCEHCDEQIPNAREYWTHFRRVHPDKKYPIQKGYICEICGKSFRGNAFLVYHKRTHFEERAFKCNQCPKAFFNRTNLQMHEKTHSERRPYPCTVCFKAFKCKGALDRHFRSHTGVKPYGCEFCGKSFGQSNSRKLHVRTVHLKQPAPYISRSRLERRRASQPAKEPPAPPLVAFAYTVQQ